MIPDRAQDASAIMLALLLAACAQVPERADSPARPVAAAAGGPAIPELPPPASESLKQVATAAPAPAVPEPVPSAPPSGTLAKPLAASEGARSVPAGPPRSAAADKNRAGRSAGGTRSGPPATATGIPVPAPASPGVPNVYREAARRAAAVGDAGWAIYYYRLHLGRNPRDVEALSELGTLYYRTGDRGRAASVLYDAARLLIESGNRERASRLAPLVGDANPALASDLYLRLGPQGGR